jgi:hypothetical protein
MPLKDSQYYEGAADSEEDKSSWPKTTGESCLQSSDGLIPEFPREHRQLGLSKRQTSRPIHKSAVTQSEVSTNLLQSLSSSLQNLELHGVIEGNDTDCDDYVDDDGMNDSIHLTRRRFNRHHDDYLDYVDDDGMNDSIHLTKRRFNRHHRDIIPENDVCMEHERDDDGINKRGGIDHCRINAALPELQQQTLRAMAA